MSKQIQEWGDKYNPFNEDNNFKVYGVIHKFSDTWSPKKSFKKCYGNYYTTCYISSSAKIGLCCDLRGNPDMELCSIYDYNNVDLGWGSAKHKAIVDRINIEQCPRCTLTHINEIFENVILQDKMMCDFF